MTTNSALETNILIPDSKPISLSERLTSILNRLQPSPESLILISALFIGGGSGSAIAIFHYLIDLWENLAFDLLMGFLSVWGAWTLVFIPIVGGLVVGVMRWFFPDILGEGFSALLSDDRVEKISPLRPIVKMLAAAVSLGTGASLGPESPSVEIGSNVGILWGQTFQVSRDRSRLLLGAGAAAGLAAGFNAPIAGVFFALEVVLGASFATRAISLILLSAVVSAIVSHIFFGGHPAFDLPAYQVVSQWEWIFYLGLGLLSSLVSIAYTQGIKIVQSCFHGEIIGFGWLGKLPQLSKSILGAACVGLAAIQIPQILGVGYGTLEAILQGQKFSLGFLSLLLIVKLGVTAISLGCGLIGGIFAPAMFLGACLGAIYGNVLGAILPSEWLEIAPPAAYAMVGMAAVLAGSVRAPLTAIILLFELTRNYLIILPLMVAVGISFWVVEQLKSNQAVEALNLQQMGMNLSSEDDLEIFLQVPVATVMDYSYLPLLETMSVFGAGSTMVRSKCHTALVLDETTQLVGVVTLADIRRNIEQEWSRSHLKIGDICTKEVLYAHEDESVTEALNRMEARGLYLLPVTARDNPRQVLGVIERNRISLARDLVSTEKALSSFLSEV